MNFTYRPVPISAKTAIMAVISGLLFGAVLIFATGNNPVIIYAALIRGACGSLFAIASSIRWTIPLIFTGTAAAIAFKGGVFNMGVEGQMYMGGLAAAVVGITWRELPGCLLIPLMLIASMIAEQSRLTKLIPSSSVSTALLIGLIIVLLYQLIIRKTKFGYEFEICGINPRFARYGGVNVNKTRIGVILLSGAIAGLGGATEIMGVRYCFESRFVGDFATNGILAALLGSCSPVGTLFGAAFMGFLKAGSLTVERTTSVSRAVAVVIQCTIICFVSAKSFAAILDLKGIRPGKGNTKEGKTE